ncbi:MAG: Trans-aconitate 2-methyltransferase [bacterium]|nr:Trans-aconitate 2-methyltransferase [bacterium]
MSAPETMPPPAPESFDGLPPELVPTPLTPEQDAAITAHLAAHGVLPFDDAEGPQRFYGWVRELLGPERCAKVEELRQRRGREGAARYTDDVAFYETFSDANTARALLSTRYDYLRQTGPRVVEHLPPEGTIVDIGCCTGMLTNFYAQQRPDLQFLGLDRVPATLKTARRDAQALGLKNVRFDTADVLRLIPVRNAAGAVSTTAFWRIIAMTNEMRVQYNALEAQVDRARFLQRSHAMRYNAAVLYTLMQSIRPGGTLILMERLPDQVNAEALRILQALAGFKELAFVPVVARDEGVRQVYGMLVLERGEPPRREEEVLSELASHAPGAEPEAAAEATSSE